MYFVTNREPKGSISASAQARKYEFDLSKNAPSNSVYYCRRDGKGSYMEIGSETFMSDLRNIPAKQILFFIHGFSNLSEPDIFPRVTKLKALFDKEEKNLIEVVPLIWPCDDDAGIIKDYWDDQKSADKSAYSFARVFERFMRWRDEQPEDDPCLKRINMLSHSMGNRVFRETLAKWDEYDLAHGIPLLFRNTFLMAADIVNESLEEGKKGRLISHASRNVSVYHASDDLALRASKISNLKNKVASRRLGHTGPENMDKVLTNVYAIDCDRFNNAYDKPKGHSYFLGRKVFSHMLKSIKTGRVDVKDNPSRRVELK